MILGLSESDKRFKIAMESAGADMSVVNNWLKVYQKTKKNSVNVTNKYYTVKANLNKLLVSLEEIEKLIIDGADDVSAINRISELIRECKGMKNSFDDEFLINKDDKDFHMTLDSVIKLGTKYGCSEKMDDHIIFQSEIENLIHLAKEGTSREKPDLFALSFFYLNHSNKDLQELNFGQKVEEVHSIFRTGFYDDIAGQIRLAVINAREFSDKYSNNPDKKQNRILKDLAPLLEGIDRETEPEKVCREIIESMCKVAY